MKDTTLKNLRAVEGAQRAGRWVAMDMKSFLRYLIHTKGNKGKEKELLGPWQQKVSSDFKGIVFLQSWGDMRTVRTDWLSLEKKPWVPVLVYSVWNNATIVLATCSNYLHFTWERGPVRVCVFLGFRKYVSNKLLEAWNTWNAHWNAQ